MVFFLQVSPQNPACTCPPCINATCPAHLILLYLNVISQIIPGEEHKSWSPSLCYFLQSPMTSSFLDPNIFLSTLYSNTLSLCSSLNMRNQVSQPYKKQANLFVLILIYIFLASIWEDRTFWNEWPQALLLNINWQLLVFLIALPWIVFDGLNYEHFCFLDI